MESCWAAILKEGQEKDVIRSSDSQKTSLLDWEPQGLCVYILVNTGETSDSWCRSVNQRVWGGTGVITFLPGPLEPQGLPFGAFTRGPTTVTAKIQTHVMVSDGQWVWIFEFAQSDNNVLRQQSLIWLPQLLLA